MLAGQTSQRSLLISFWCASSKTRAASSKTRATFYKLISSFHCYFWGWNYLLSYYQVDKNMFKFAVKGAIKQSSDLGMQYFFSDFKQVFSNGEKLFPIFFLIHKNFWYQLGDEMAYCIKLLYSRPWRQVFKLFHVWSVVNLNKNSVVSSILSWKM